MKDGSGPKVGKGAGKGTGKGERQLSVRVKTSRGRTVSQQRWLQRQLNDPYVAKARREGYRSRAAFKLSEIDEKYGLLKPGQRIVDLGCAPGGWLQVAARKIGLAQNDTGTGAEAEAEADNVDQAARPRRNNRAAIVGIDLLPVDPMAGVTLFELDFMADETPDLLKSAMGGPADLVLSDMAANTTGHKQTDHLKIIGLAEAAAEFAAEILRPGGAFLVKLFQGGETASLITQLKRDYRLVRHVKPNASRTDSSELYVLATGFRREVETADQETAD
jgi:23S rRNA (uridine2552-2'-O)-methyltransferase